MRTLYGDGIHDDTLALQERIDGAGCELRLPEPKVRYLISAPLELPSNFRLVLPRYAEVRLADGSDCVMLRNRTVPGPARRVNDGIFDYVNVYSPDAPCENIEVTGGIWNLNNRGQSPNPLLIKSGDGNWNFKTSSPTEKSPDDPSNAAPSYNGYIFLFYHVKNLRISSLTLKDPVTFAVTLDRVSYFTVDHITFDFNYGNPLACNMDGIHLNGGCHHGSISELQGACYDDLVALNADEGLGGPISDVTIRGIRAEDCHSAVRLLSANHPVRNVHISDVYGTFFQYCIGLTRYYETRDRGCLENITLDNLCVSKAERLPVYNHNNPGEWVFALIHADSRLLIRNLRISDFHRSERINPVETIYVDRDAEIDGLFLENVTAENLTGGGEMPLMVNRGTIRKLRASAVYSDGEEWTPGV